MKLQLNAETTPNSAQIVSDTVVITSIYDGLDLLGNAQYLGARHIIAEERHFAESFFDLSTGLAGDILQKFSNYRMKLTILGDWSEIQSKALRDFVRECHRGDSFRFEPRHF